MLVSICCGRNSVWAEKQLYEQKRLMSMHTSNIEKTGEELNLEKVALEKDMDVIAAYARKLSYVGDDEKLVKISGLSVAGKHLYNPGTVLLHKEVRYISEAVCKGVGLVVFALVYLILLLIDVTKSSVKERTSSVKYYDVIKGARTV